LTNDDQPAFSGAATDTYGGIVMSGDLLRAKYNKRFHGLSKHSDVVGWSLVLMFLGQIALSVYLGHLLLESGQGVWIVVGTLALMLFIGTRFRALNNIVHECSHATFCASRNQNVMIGRLCSAVTMGCFAEYRDKHLSHHAHLGDYESDLDLQGIEDLKLHEPLDRKTILRHIVTPLLGRHLPYYLHLNRSSRDGRGFVALKVGLLVGVLALTWVAPLTSLLFVVAPFVLVYSALNYWADCMDHAGLIHGEDELGQSRNILAPKPLALLFFPRHDGYHLVHHLFPHVPARHLAATHEVLLADEVYSARSNAVDGVRSLLETPPSVTSTREAA
jgi:fatty acid desaturase